MSSNIPKITIEDYLATLDKIFTDSIKYKIIELKNLVLSVSENNGKIFIFGNGGSFAVAEHAAVDLSKGIFQSSGKKIRVFNPLASNSTLTAFANDYSYGDSVVESLKIMADEGDLLITVSSSGKSRNITKALEFGLENGLRTVSVVGFIDFPEIHRKSELLIAFAVDNYGITEDASQILFHLLKELIIQDLNEES